ncbi:MAG: hypothetical protein RLZZ15_2337 [Verrucomicrobiota bacterium]|jgi:predicted cupin superfamily sugar epimerase
MHAHAAQQLIDRLRMTRIPQEGPWFAPTFRADESVAFTAPAAAARYAGPRAAYSAIYCVLTREDFSALHRLASDDLWHFYDGAPVELLQLHPDGRAETTLLGRDLADGQHPQLRVPRGVWQAARPLGGADAWSFIGNTLAPAFDYADFEIGYRDELQARFPASAERIAAFTRAEFARRP